jgi:hypothetical protein
LGDDVRNIDTHNTSDGCSNPINIEVHKHLAVGGRNKVLKLKSGSRLINKNLDVPNVANIDSQRNS